MAPEAIDMGLVQKSFLSGPGLFSGALAVSFMEGIVSQVCSQIITTRWAPTR